ncbi:uncharacterized protein [Neodiprion pinetum]|uniref:Uncharacterized protein LOC107216681 n=1 Tax=Neodiprion lecontei TaxID=441921 RepID=A0A6J0B2Y6_NEOLC|nr:uncharacterized protein LOC107216681 [Neodiprion lecontei]XP_046469522.1 uncharacterized protein LOC124212927 [Neodiprion pinetum]XP_046469523.1 uncharacterized protein LOC124212927 [Neodiprion pinetum]XP_046469524.1 uncharacterized protein LOC124212927 [Neodiprion pinetum]XP_046469525.1 uncharacterized protein LOC124212927 [Neodiprion pinetum]XP_046469526.1 uncharacterized protein LOC124212927 [Neodiprion pinetum]XP_046469527.1 uncharacterized protein LOC124212927 [Neodiprion pinetum]XP_
MEFDYELRQDVLGFLRSLSTIALPPTLDASRERLLKRIGDNGEPPDEYVNMQPDKPLSNCSTQRPDSSEDYITPCIPSFLHKNSLIKIRSATETKIPTTFPKHFASPSRPPTYVQPLPPTDSPVIQRPYHDTQSSTNVVSTVKQDELATVEEIDDSESTEIYAKMNAQEAEAKSQKFEQLRRKERRFVFEGTRLFWAALLDAHILCYNNKRDPEPTQVLPLKGSTCQPVNAKQFSPKKLVDSTFEICLKDNRKFQFIAVAPTDMSQWMTAIHKIQEKTATANQASQPVKAIPKPVKLEPCPTDRNSNEDYEDLVITSIQEALNLPPKFPTSNYVHEKSLTTSTAESSINSKSPMLPQKVPAKYVGELSEPKSSKPSKPAPPRVLIPTPRKLPSLPLSEEFPNEDKDMVYSMIPEENPTSQDVDFKGDVEQADLYDDIDSILQKVKSIETRNVDVVQQTQASVHESEGSDTYDDVVQVKEEVQNLRKMEKVMQKTTENDIEKQAPKTPTKSSAFRSILGRIRQKSESPQKGDSKKNPISLSPQNNDNISAPYNKSLPLDENSEELKRSDINTGALDLSDYNSPPPPRPLLDKKPLDHEIEEQMIYDDIGIKSNEPVNCIVKPVKILDDKQKTNALLMNNKSVFEKQSVASLSYKKFSKVVRNLDKSFEDDIYQNQPAESNLEESSEHYQIPVNPDAGAQTPPPNSLSDNNGEEIYDDVGIVAQKKRANQEAKSKPMVQTPSNGVWTLPKAKSSEIKLFAKTNKFSTFKPEESSSEKKVRQLFSGGIKFKMPQAKQYITKRGACHIGNDIYDDCH